MRDSGSSFCFWKSDAASAFCLKSSTRGSSEASSSLRLVARGFDLGLQRVALALDGGARLVATRGGIGGDAALRGPQVVALRAQLRDLAFARGLLLLVDFLLLLGELVARSRPLHVRCCSALIRWPSCSAFMSAA